MNMLATIVPKSDQLNADDLIGQTKTITVTKVVIVAGDQPVSIHFEGDDGKPYKPGKSMRRVLVKVWGPDANAYIGRSMSLYCDDAVRFGGVNVGGIRISHMSHIDEPVTMALTEKKGSKKPFRVQPLASPKPAEKWRSYNPSGKEVMAESVAQWVKWNTAFIKAFEGAEDIRAWAAKMQPEFVALEAVDAGAVEHVQGLVKDRLETLADKPAEDEA